MNEIQKKKRVVWLDVVRLVALFTVVCCHSSDPFNYVFGDTSDNVADIQFWGAVYGSLVRPCVPLFVMITGALLLPVKTNNVGTFYKKRISRVFWPFLIWSVVYALFPWITGVLGCDPSTILVFFPFSGEDAAQQSLALSLQSVANIPMNFSNIGVHMWYIYLLIGLYLYLPIFSAWVEKATEKQKRYFLLAWAVTLVVPYYQQYVSPYLWGSCSWNGFYMLYYFAGFNGYLLLGHYLRHHDFSWGQTLGYGIPMFLVGYAVTYFGFTGVRALPEYSDELLELFFTFCSLNVAIMTIPVFLIFKKVNVTSPKIQQLLANLTLCGFGIYMVHYLLTGPSILLMRTLEIPLPLQLPLGAIVAFLASWIISATVHKALGKKAVYLVG